MMIKTFKHKGLEDFFNHGTKKGIKPDHSAKLARILDRLDSSLSIKDMSLPGFKLHKLSGKEKETWSVTVTGNWRVIFYFEDGDAFIVNYLDYH